MGSFHAPPRGRSSCGSAGSRHVWKKLSDWHSSTLLKGHNMIKFICCCRDEMCLHVATAKSLGPRSLPASTRSSREPHSRRTLRIIVIVDGIAYSIVAI